MDFIANVAEYPEAVRRFQTYDFAPTMIQAVAENVWDIVPSDKKDGCDAPEEQLEVVLEYLDIYMAQYA